jgi:hypothetical protein
VRAIDADDVLASCLDLTAIRGGTSLESYPGDAISRSGAHRALQHLDAELNSEHLTTDARPIA